MNRRKWIASAGAGLAAARLPPLRAQSKLPLTLACWDYDRTRPLMDGRVKVDGAELNYLNLPVEETFFRMLRGREFDASEMSLSSYGFPYSSPTRPSSLFPCFPRASSAIPAFLSTRIVASASLPTCAASASARLSIR